MPFARAPAIATPTTIHTTLMDRCGCQCSRHVERSGSAAARLCETAHCLFPVFANLASSPPSYASPITSSPRFRTPRGDGVVSGGEGSGPGHRMTSRGTFRSGDTQVIPGKLRSCWPLGRKDGFRMANRDQETARTSDTPEKADASGVTADSIEQRVVAFAEHLGRIAGTVQARAEGWMDRETLSRQLATVRDAAAELLEQLAGGTAASRMKPEAAPARGENRGRSGGRSTRPARNIVSRCRRTRARTPSTVRRRKCGRQRRW